MAEIVYQKRLLTVADYLEMGRQGILRSDERVELIRGEIVVRAPQGPVHASCVRRLNTLFSRRLFEHGVEVVEVSVQLPLAASEHDAPEPDVALLRIADYADRHPDGSDVLLAVEVAVCARATTNVPATTSSAPRRPSRSGASVKKRKPQSAAKTIWT